MNNQQFRRLVLDTPSASTRANKTSPVDETSPKQDAGVAGATPRALALGSRMRSSIPMTPRSVTGVDFARQLAEQRRESQQPPTKRFKSSAAPKGTKLPTGYQDRAALLRQVQDESGSDIEKRIQALEEMVKLGQIDRATFDKIRSELGVGGDVKSTHMVKGLDWDLLKRVKAGEDVTKTSEETPASSEPQNEEGLDQAEDVDEAFDRVLEEKEQTVLPSAPKEKKEKKGTMAPPLLPAKKTRDEILRELKASRAAAAAATATSHSSEPALGGKFKRIGESKVEKKRFIEQDENGRRREVLVITDAEGKTKRKVRWLDKPGESNGLLVPEKDAKPLGMEVPAEIAAKVAAPPSTDQDDDIFAGVGADYNPLGDEDEDDNSSDEDEGQIQTTEKASISANEEKPAVEPHKPRNYFSTSTKDEPPESDRRANPLTTDPTLLAALKRAAALRQASPSAGAVSGEGEEDVDDETLLRRKKFLEEARRREALDAADLDFGFGGSRNEDEEDDEAVVFENEGSKKRKRGPKKKKGDKNSAADVLRVLEGRKKD
ncbi:hypothetical protein Aspvir_002667 [Aspergillus viridinutans]|uniref:RED-like N-terminal domain-containing protein n=1 Tax=Aspergillus viridinutans TaxID=75553 RepID=A0A9P3CB56_ASPVI|nr:uncharacterized protein Aspvir_002667 [Aspergillus viridinutans]GIK07014.1 hypothetical protein Aspvir_002667 [Aspergillus viridinutans]